MVWVLEYAFLVALILDRSVHCARSVPVLTIGMLNALLFPVEQRTKSTTYSRCRIKRDAKITEKEEGVGRHSRWKIYNGSVVSRGESSGGIMLGMRSSRMTLADAWKHVTFGYYGVGSFIIVKL